MWSLTSSRTSNPRPPTKRARRWALETLEGRVLLSGLPTLSVGDATVIEGNQGTGYAEVVVSLSQRSTKTVTVSYGTADGTARAGGDYAPASGKLSFAPGQTTKTIRVAVTDDRLVEPDESFSVTISGAKNAKIADASGLVTIVDDEPRITIESDLLVAEGDSGTTLFTFTVRLSAAHDEEVTVDYATQDGTATVDDDDYRAAAGTLRFAPGETTKTITVEVVGDLAPEGNQSFTVNLSGASANAFILTGQGTCIIDEDDGYIDDDYFYGSDPGWDYVYGYSWY